MVRKETFEIKIDFINFYLYVYENRYRKKSRVFLLQI